MIERIFFIANLVQVVLIAPAAVYGVVRIIRRRIAFRRALKYCARDESGVLYVRDPQSGSMHKLQQGLDGRLYVKREKLTKPQKKKLRRATQKLREAMR